MKKFIVFTAIAVTVMSITTVHAQVSVNVNIGAQPVWGPTGYDHADFYYLPDIGVYYSVVKQQYVFREGNAWVFRKTLPPQYASFDLYKSYKVVLNEKKPWLRDEEYRKKYQPFRNRHDQAVIRDSHEEKYFVVKEHPEHDKWAREHKHH